MSAGTDELDFGRIAEILGKFRNPEIIRLIRDIAEHVQSELITPDDVATCIKVARIDLHFFSVLRDLVYLAQVDAADELWPEARESAEPEEKTRGWADRQKKDRESRVTPSDEQMISDEKMISDVKARTSNN